MTEDVKNVADVSSLFIAWAALVEWLPAVAALMSIIWTGIRIYEWAKRKWN